jgi:hypothetical protein
MVVIGGVCLLVAASLVLFVHDTAGRSQPGAVIEGDEREPFILAEAVQPVPSTGLLDE